MERLLAHWKSFKDRKEEKRARQEERHGGENEQNMAC